MFGWFKGKKQSVNAFVAPINALDTPVTRAKLVSLVRWAISDKSMLLDTAKPNCAFVLNQRGDVQFKWISESDNVDDVITFALLGQLSTYRELLAMCVQEIKAGTFSDAFFRGPSLILMDRVAIEAINEMKRTYEQEQS